MAGPYRPERSDAARDGTQLAPGRAARPGAGPRKRAAAATGPAAAADRAFEMRRARHLKQPRALLVAVVLVLLLAPGAAAAAPCPAANPYPGDGAGERAIAAWMARGATATGLPGELPVMAALTESGLRNLPDTGSGYAGFFQMSTGYLDRGPYAGFEARPELQLRWFTTAAAAVRERGLAAGRPDPLADELAWGEWIADVERPATRYRGRYQPQLDRARELIAGGCAAAPAGGAISLWGGTEQRLRRRVRVALVCAVACDASARGTLRLPQRRRRFELIPASGSASAGGEKLKLALGLPRAAIRAGRRALRRGEPVRARIDVSAIDGAGTESRGRRVVRLG